MSGAARTDRRPSPSSYRTSPSQTVTGRGAISVTCPSALLHGTHPTHRLVALRVRERGSRCAARTARPMCLPCCAGPLRTGAQRAGIGGTLPDVWNTAQMGFDVGRRQRRGRTSPGLNCVELMICAVVSLRGLRAPGDAWGVAWTASSGDNHFTHHRHHLVH